MIKIEIGDTPEQVGEFALKATKDPLVITKDGKPLVIIRSVEDEDWETISLGLNPKFINLMEESRRTEKEKGFIPFEQVCEEFGYTPKQKKDR